jgi:hypothetical protein
LLRDPRAERFRRARIFADFHQWEAETRYPDFASKVYVSKRYGTMPNPKKEVPRPALIYETSCNDNGSVCLSSRNDG